MQQIHFNRVCDDNHIKLFANADNNSLEKRSCEQFQYLHQIIDQDNRKTDNEFRDNDNIQHNESLIRRFLSFIEPKVIMKHRNNYALYIFSPINRYANSTYIFGCKFLQKRKIIIFWYHKI